MSEQEQPGVESGEMVTMGSDEARTRLPEVLNQAKYRGRRTVITKNGTPWAMVVPVPVPVPGVGEGEA